MEETCLLAGKAGPCLRYEPQGAPSRCITVSKTPFLIGRMRDQVDGWLAHPTVGKLHAEIRLEKGMHTLVDLNSRNGTRVNGRPLTPYEPCVLRTNDHILISGETLVFLEQAQS
jgi:pSer/pThr/pTyr-binding forkhead associated (FHA) protein